MIQHPLSKLFPAMPADELASLSRDIKSNGLKHAIVMYEGKVLDGWHRHQACQMAGVPCREEKFTGSDPVSFVRSNNWHRRHMTTSQRAITEVQLSEWAPEGHPKLTGPNGPVKSNATMAEEAQVGVNTIKRAKEVDRNGSDALKEAVKEGEISITKAAKVAKQPKEKQAKAMKEKAPKQAKAKKADSVDWKAKHDALLEDYNALKENRDDLVDELKTCEAIRTDTQAVEMQKLRAEVKHITRRRDELMASAHEMRKECTRWQTRAKQAGWKPRK